MRPGVTSSGKVGDLGRSLEELKTETLRDVPCNVAVHQPGTGVVSRESQSQPSVTGQSGSVTTRRVVELQARGEGVVPSTDTRSEDVEVVTVQVNWLSFCVSNV